MTVATTTPVVFYNGDNSTQTFTFPFQVMNTSTDLFVYFVVGGVATLQTAGFTVSQNIGTLPQAGTITFTTAPASGTTISIVRDTVEQRTTSYLSGSIQPATLNADVDNTVLMVQDVNYQAPNRDGAGNYNFSSNRLTNVGNPVNPNDGVNLTTAQSLLVIPVALASNTTVALSGTGSQFSITGNTTVDYITGGVNGKVITLYFAKALTLVNNAGGGSTNGILTLTGSNTSISSGQIVSLEYNGTQWQQNQAIATNTATAITSITTNASYYPVIVSATSGSLPFNAGSGLTFNPNTNVLSTTTFVGNLTGIAANVTTNANLTGPIVSTGNATRINAQTGTGNTFVMSVGPTITGHPTIEGITSTGATGTANIVFSTSPTITGLTLAAGTTTVDPITLTTGNLLTSPVGGSIEYDGTSFYHTNEATSGRAFVPGEQYFHLTSSGSGITSLANFFGGTSNITLVSGAYYEIDIYCFFTMGSTGSVVTWHLTNTNAPTYMDVIYEMSPVTGIVTPPGTATMLLGQIIGGVTADQTIATASLSSNSKQYAHFKIFLQNSVGTSLKIQAVETTTTTAFTPNIGSRWTCVRRPASNTGIFVA